VPQLVAPRFVVAALVAGALSFALNDWPYKLGLLAAVAGGVVAGMVVESYIDKDSARTREAK
jgi:hypothetical protein